MKLSPQLFNQLPGIQQDQVLATPNVAEPQNMMNEALTLPEEAQASLANVVQEQAMAWADILRKGRIVEEAKVKKRASNLYRPAVAEYARQLDSGESRPKPGSYAGKVDDAVSQSPISTIGVPHVADVKADIEGWHENQKDKIAKELGIEDDDSLMASVGEELDSLFITPKANILAVIQDQYTQEAKRMAADYLSEISLEAVNNKEMSNEKAINYLQSMVEAGVFQDWDTIALLKEYEKNKDNNQMNFDAANDPIKFVEAVENNTWKTDYPNASPNFVMAAYGRYKPVSVQETKSQTKKRETAERELSAMVLSQNEKNRPVTLINDILGGKETLSKQELLKLIGEETQPTLSKRRVAELMESGKWKGIKAHEFSSFLNGAYATLKAEHKAGVSKQQTLTKENFREQSVRFREKLGVNQGWTQAWFQANGIGNGPGWWNDAGYNGMGFELERKNLDSIWKWAQKKNELMSKVEDQNITHPQMLKMLEELAPQKGIEKGDSTDAIDWKDKEYVSLKGYLQKTFLDPSDLSKEVSDRAGLSMELTGSAETWTPGTPIPVKQIIEFEENFHELEKPESAADYLSKGYRIVPKPLLNLMEKTLATAKGSESAGDMEGFLGLFEVHYPDKFHQQIAVREFAEESKEFDPSYLLFTDPAIDKQGYPMPSVNMDRMIQAAVAKSDNLKTQINAKYPGDSFVDDLIGNDKASGKVFYSDFGIGNATAMRSSPTATEPYRALHERMAMKLKLENPDMDAEEAAEEAHYQLFDSRYKIYKNPEDENQVLFMNQSEFARGYAGTAEPEDVTKAEQMVIAGIAPALLMSIHGVEKDFAKQTRESPLKFELQGREGAVNRNINNLFRKLGDEIGIAEDALKRNPNIDILPVPNEDNTGRYYKLIHPDTGVWVWLRGEDGSKWEIPTSTIADLTFQTHLRSLYYKMNDYLEGSQNPFQRGFETFGKIKPDWLPDVDPKVAERFFETRTPMQLLEEVAGSQAFFSDTVDLDVSVKEWPFDYTALNAAPNFIWMIGGIERSHLKTHFIPELKRRYKTDNPTKEQILELADEYVNDYADLTGAFYFDKIWDFFGVNPLKPENWILPDNLEYKRDIEINMLKEFEESRIPPSQTLKEEVLKEVIPPQS